MIAAIAKNNALGKDNDLLWHLPADLKRFKNTTSGYPIIMGRKTYESIGKPLPNRTNIIITRNTDYFVDGCLIARNLQDALQLVKDVEHVFIIGGAQIYKQALEQELADFLDITLVHQNFEADVFFPKIDSKKWKLISQEDFKKDEKNPLNYSFLKYKKLIDSIRSSST
ncbi:MAG: dihydrofolate reductase [Polaribacter sp.]|nr:dihydrofolate reductase [Polaribacter sp.]